MKRGVGIGDIHAGSIYAPLPPNFTAYDGSLILPNQAQDYLWKCWDDFTWRVSRFDPDFIIVNGDIVEGPQKKSTGFEVQLPASRDQISSCVETLKLLKQRAPKAKWFFTAGCFVPGTRVLTKDLRWLPVEKLEVGSELWAIDEYGPNRQWKKSVLTAKKVYPKPVSEVRFSDGTVLVATDDHPWLVRPWVGHNRLQWRMTRELRPGLTIIHKIPTWEHIKDYDSGWLAGIYDGEGCIHKDSQIPNFTQNPGLVLDRAVSQMKNLGFEYRVSDKRPNDSTKVVCPVGGMVEGLRLLGTIRPERLINNLDLHQRLEFRSEPLTIVSVTPLGEEEIVGISTSSGTYFAEGFAVHNTPYHTGEWHDAEETIAQIMGGETYPSIGVGKYCREVLWLRTEGVILEATHHPTGSTTGFYRMTSLDRDGQWSAMAAKDPSKGIPKSDVLIRSHLHFFGHVEHASKQIIQLPCWKLGDRHSRKSGLHRFIPDIGGVFFEVDGTAKERGESPCEIEKELYSLPPVKVTDL